MWESQACYTEKSMHAEDSKLTRERYHRWVMHRSGQNLPRLGEGDLGTATG
jgi:hypothetical protein